MQFRLTLKRRILVAFAVFGLVLSTTMSFSLYAFLGVIEEAIIEQTMQYELSRIERPATDGDRTREGTETVTIWSVPLQNTVEVPDYLRLLPPGVHDVEHAGRQYRVQVRDDRDLRRYLRFDVTQIVRRDREVLAALAKSAVLAVALSIVAGWLLAKRVSQPLRRLSENLHALESGTQDEDSLLAYADDEVGALARRFRDYHRNFREMLDREQEFASNVSHELRTPVTSINMAVEVLANDPSISKRQGERLERIQRAGREMSELVRTFMLLARTEENEPKGDSSCDVNKTTRTVLEDQQVWLGDKPVTVAFHEHSHLVIDAPNGVVAVLIANVVRNAFRYTQRGCVHVSVTDTGLIVEDSGPGIGSNLAGRLFERNVHGPRGSGLGLSIVKRICERYGWSISIQSSPETGTRFGVTFLHAGQENADGGMRA